MKRIQKRIIAAVLGMVMVLGCSVCSFADVKMDEHAVQYVFITDKGENTDISLFAKTKCVVVNSTSAALTIYVDGNLFTTLKTGAQTKLSANGNTDAAFSYESGSGELYVTSVAFGNAASVTPALMVEFQNGKYGASSTGSNAGNSTSAPASEDVVATKDYAKAIIDYAQSKGYTLADSSEDSTYDAEWLLFVSKNNKYEINVMLSNELYADQLYNYVDVENYRGTVAEYGDLKLSEFCKLFDKYAK